MRALFKRTAAFGADADMAESFCRVTTVDVLEAPWGTCLAFKARRFAKARELSLSPENNASRASFQSSALYQLPKYEANAASI
jgi:hypothetical protein